MRRILLLIILMSVFCVSSYAYDYYAIEKKDGTIDTLTYDPSSGALERIIVSYGDNFKRIIKLDKSDFPDNRVDRNYWKLSEIPVGKKIVVDESKKQEDLLKEQQKALEKDAVLQKLKITEAELKKIVG